MIIKILWTLIGLNAATFVIVFIYFLISTDGRNVDTMEKGWMTILAILGIVIILLAAIPLYMSQSRFSMILSAFFAVLPLVIALSFWISNHMPSFGKKETLAEVYFKDKVQRQIAGAIEVSDTVMLPIYIKGQNVNIQGNRVWDADGLNYLQFAIRMRSHRNAVFTEKANLAIIKMLIDAGSSTTRALAEGIADLPVETIAALLDAGADPNTHGFVSRDPLLFAAIRPSKRETDIAILLAKRGADVNAKNSENITPLMAAANNAGTSKNWAETWRFVLYLLKDAKADYHYKRFDGVSLTTTIAAIKARAIEEHVMMSPGFIAVDEWLMQHP
ncbi:hypothetical protein MUK70_13570 [Dyadobacter chenwenxiniae]|uniref:Ankyrin repeat domain-containing protein n=1 Tax=Dyadobacter chenwenxiniae TaxID=2906456 RepID=A0A9X1PGN1_9BACT|nr:hypothetical protein [Dyadobacter chenwenxiniae]MCF0060271.1 hypothetical protein [Dyadobacter chenwenxiniae]UON86009.1 hypothetical protein MUK70_13570 [Dyadobacter chenwenxiniae]